MTNMTNFVNIVTMFETYIRPLHSTDAPFTLRIWKKGQVLIFQQLA